MTEDKNSIPLVIAAKTMFKGAVIGHVSNGGGIIKLTEFVGLKFVALNDKFCQIQVIIPKGDETIKNQSWIKTKEKIIQKKELKAVSLSMDIEHEELL